MAADRANHHDPQRDARVLGVLWRLPPELWREPRRERLPVPMRRELDRMDPAALRGLLVELIYRLESHASQETDNR